MATRIPEARTGTPDAFSIWAWKTIDRPTGTGLFTAFGVSTTWKFRAWYTGLVERASGVAETAEMTNGVSRPGFVWRFGELRM
jgi:hypothetical protein